MNTITFPGLGLSFEINRVAFQIGNFSIYWYGIIIAVGFAIGMAVCFRLCPKMGIKQNDLLDIAIFAVPLGVIGARLYYIIFYLDLYLKADGSLDLAACLNIHRGGLAIYGGIIAGTLTVFLATRYKKIPFLAFADVAVFAVFIGQIVGRWGNFVNAEAHGGETTLPWRMGIETTVNGVRQYAEVHPTFLYESLWNLLGLCLIFLILHLGLQKFDGMLFLLYVAWYGFGRGLIEGLRTDSLYFFSTGIRTSQMVGFLSFLIALALIIWKLRTHPKPENLYVNRQTDPNNREET